jgi:hypothetical protein
MPNHQISQRQCEGYKKVFFVNLCTAPLLEHPAYHVSAQLWSVKFTGKQVAVGRCIRGKKMKDNLPETYFFMI